MHPVKHHLSNKLTWMSRQLRKMNDAATIMNWIAAMQAVYTLLDSFSGNTNIAQIEKHDSRELSHSLPLQKQGSDMNDLQQCRTSENSCGNENSKTVAISQKVMRRLVVRGKRSLLSFTKANCMIPEKKEEHAQIPEKVVTSSSAVTESATYQKTTRRRAWEDVKLWRGNVPDVEQSPASSVIENMEYSNNSVISSEGCRECLRRMLQKHINYYYGNREAKYRFELLLRDLGKELKFDRARWDKSFRDFVKKELKVYFDPD